MYKKTKKRVGEIWLFNFPLEEEAVIYFLKIGFIIGSFCLFVWAYKQMFPEIERENLVNPLQVVAQLACFLFNLQHSKKTRHLLLLCFCLSLLSSLHLKGIDGGILSCGLLLYSFVILFFPLDYAPLIVFLGYFLDQGLAKWGFYLAFQQVGYHTLSFFLEREKSSATRILDYLLLILIQTFFGFVNFGDFYFAEPLKLAALLSGACIIFISLARRATWALLLAFVFYLLLSLFIGIIISKSEKLIRGIPQGLFIFIFLHLWPFVALFLFNDSLPRKKQPLIPLFFGGVFFLLGYFPELAWLEKWIEGIDLLLLALGLFSFMEGDKDKEG